MKKKTKNVTPLSAPADELRRDLVHKIIVYMGAAELKATEIPGLTLHRRVAKTAPCPATYQPSVIFIPQGRKQVDLGRTSFIYDARRFLLTSVDLPTVARVVDASEEKPCLALRLKLEIPIIRDLLSREEVHAAPLPRRNAPAMSTAPVTPELLSAFCRLIDLLSTPQDIPFLSEMIQREIFYRILRGPEGARLRAIATLGDQSHRTAKAIAWITTNYAKPLRVEDLADIASMGVSTLHHHFRMLTSMSPVQYQKQIRLQAARSLMLSHGLDAATAAFEVGYESPTQFNREYSRFYGQPPMRDVRAIRATGAPSPASPSSQQNVA